MTPVFAVRQSVDTDDVVVHDTSTVHDSVHSASAPASAATTARESLRPQLNPFLPGAR